MTCKAIIKIDDKSIISDFLLQRKEFAGSIIKIEICYSNDFYEGEIELNKLTLIETTIERFLINLNILNDIIDKHNIPF